MLPGSTSTCETRKPSRGGVTVISSIGSKTPKTSAVAAKHTFVALTTVTVTPLMSCANAGAGGITHSAASANTAARRRLFSHL